MIEIYSEKKIVVHFRDGMVTETQRTEGGVMGSLPRLIDYRQGFFFLTSND